jgi:enamine deaminase RidA (YjgF/YER057c/UK114 family)
VRTGNLLFLAGKGPGSVKGKLGLEFSVDQGYQHARSVGLALLAVMKAELGSLDRVKRVVKVLGMVNAVPEFTDHPKVINGCSDLFVEVFGDAGKHARSAVGMSSLPMGIPVEIEVIVEVS